MLNNFEIEKAAQLIKNGELVAFPTETVYGLGADAFNPKAVAKIFEIKKRPAFNPLIVHICNISDLARVVANVDEHLIKLVEKFWPGPLTIVTKKHLDISEIVTGGLPTVAVRMPANDIAIELIRKAETPIAAPSANRFGMLSPTTAEHVRKQLPEVKCILNGGTTNIGIESTVIELDCGQYKILRSGVILAQDIEKIIPTKLGTFGENQIKSPGLLKSHYSPRKPVYILGNEPKNLIECKIGLLAFNEVNNKYDFHCVEILSVKKNLNEAAANFFGALHRLEESDVDLILAEPLPKKGIGIAIMDRLEKATYKFLPE
jgi:L-threonylcarbamoyladenylate synthase